MGTINQFTACTDELLLQKASQGDEEAFENLVHRYEGRVINLIYRYTRSAAEAEDIAAEVFFKVWKNAATFKGKSSFSTWLHRIAVNTCLNVRKKTVNAPVFEYLDREISTEEGERKRELPDTSTAQPDTVAHNDERNRLIRSAMDALAPQQKMAFILCWFEGNSYAEIAEIMNITVAAVESLLFRAKENLRKKLIALK